MLDKYTLVDLTHTLDDAVPTWTGRSGFQEKIRTDYSEGCRAQNYQMHAGIGTHMDAPSHFIEDGDHIADIPLKNLVIPLCVIDVSAKVRPDLFISPEDILLYEGQHGAIPKGSFVAAYTGWGKKWEDRTKFRNPDKKGHMHFPGFNLDAAKLLLERDIVGLGIDTLSPDGSHAEPYFPVHVAVLGADKYIVENLDNLDKMPPKGAFIAILPIKVRSGTEAPIRAMGLIPK